jgi:hypothetical protein
MYVFAETSPSEETKQTQQKEESKANQNQAEKITGPGTSADQPLIECGGIKRNGTAQDECTLGDLNQLVQSLLNLVFMFGGLIVAGMFMYAGFLLITSVGDTAKIQKAKEIFRRVVIGFLIMFLAYLTIKNLLDKLDLDSDVKPLFDKLFK